LRSDDSIKTFAAASSGSGNNQAQFGQEDMTPLGIDVNAKAYVAFVANQTQTSKEEYEHFKSKYAAKSCFGQINVPFQTF
jgi:hypothetical protein